MNAQVCYRDEEARNRSATIETASPLMYHVIFQGLEDYMFYLPINLKQQTHG